jgi:hypothetical protein
MPRGQRILSALAGGLVGFAAITISAQIPPRQSLRGHVLEAVARYHMPPVGRPSAAKQLHLAIGLPLRDEPALDDLLREIYDPASPNYRQYLTPEQFAERFGPAEEDYQALAAFMASNGLAVTGIHPNRVVLDVQGSVADIERVFHVTLRTYAHPAEARDFYAPDVEPAVDLAVPLLHVSGLDNYSLPHPGIRVRPAEAISGATPNSGAGPGSTYTAQDLRAAYVPGVALTGSGQTVALLEFDGYYAADIVSYTRQAGLPCVLTTNVPVNGGVSVVGSGNVEVALDIDMVIALAPGLSKIIVYEAPNGSTPWSTILSRIANDNLARQISSSWGGGSLDPTSEGIYKQMAAQGQSFFNAVGDNDAFTGSIPFPSDSTNITQVGGTVLTTTGPGGTYVSETVWNDRTSNPNGGYWGSSGGISPTYHIPAWQLGINMTTNQGSITMRNTPDVALTAANLFIVANNGTNYKAGGTSAAAPLWAAVTALANQQAEAGARPAIGFINPAIYAIGKSNIYNDCFHDITTGDNTWPGSPTKFYATNGYDLCTGWGTPTATNLLNNLAGAPDALVIQPGTGFLTNGPAGGLFTATAQDFVVTNAGTGSLNWQLANTSLWLNVSSSSGTLSAGGPAATVTVSLNPAVTNFSPGVYAANVVFTNLNSGGRQSRQFVFQMSLQNGGFETGDTTGWVLTGDGGGDDFVDTGANITPHSGKYVAVFGETNGLAYLSQTIPTIAGRSYLLSLWLNSSYHSPGKGGTTPNEFSVSWNGATLFDQTNVGVVNWTNLQFVVNATGSNTVLQIGGRDVPWYLGLDDVTVTPIPNLLLEGVMKTNSNFKFSWNTLSNIVYRAQYKTNLLQTNWITFSTNAGNGSILWVTNAIGPDPWRFYRVIIP